MASEGFVRLGDGVTVGGVGFSFSRVGCTGGWRWV